LVIVKGKVGIKKKKEEFFGKKTRKGSRTSSPEAQGYQLATRGIAFPHTIGSRGADNTKTEMRGDRKQKEVDRKERAKRLLSQEGLEKEYPSDLAWGGGV